LARCRPDIAVVDVDANWLLEIQGVINRELIGISGLRRGTALCVLFLIERHSKLRQENILPPAPPSDIGIGCCTHKGQKNPKRSRAGKKYLSTVLHSCDSGLYRTISEYFYPAG
jgi:hypothetical protein